MKDIKKGVIHNANKQSDDITLEVALYPYIPDQASFRAAVCEMWKQKHPHVKLHFVEWDCYYNEPDGLEDKLDVFVFDSVFFFYYKEKGYLLPIPEEIVERKTDIIPFAIEGCKFDGLLYALPQLLCADFIYTRKDDEELSNVSDLITLYSILGDRKQNSLIPKENEGLLINMADRPFTKSVMYLHAMTDVLRKKSELIELPSLLNLSEDILSRLRLLCRMGGKEQVRYWPEDNDLYVRARWFADGKGRAYIGFSEALSVLGDYVDKTAIHLFSYDTKKKAPLVYADMVGISSRISKDKMELAYDLANILISEDVLIQMSTSLNGSSSLQYLLTARRSVYNKLGNDYHAYSGLKEIMDNPDNQVFRIGTRTLHLMSELEKALSEQIFNY